MRVVEASELGRPRTWAYERIAHALIWADHRAQVPRVLVAMREAIDPTEPKSRDQALAEIAKLQARLGLGDEALRTMASVTASWHDLTAIAHVFADTGDKGRFLQLLPACVYHLAGVYTLCGILAEFYPESAAALARHMGADGP